MGWNNWLYAERLGQKEQAPKPMTLADKIRSMSDEELAYYWANHHDSFCRDKKGCSGLLDIDQCIPEEWCVECALELLQQPAEEG